jgi:hypothetical protein
MKICKAKKEVESKALIVAQPQNVQHTVTPQPIGQNVYINNYVVDNSINVTNNIIVVDANNLDKIQLLSDHITKQTFKKICQNISDSKVLLSRFGKEIFKNPSNLCVKKTNLKSKTSKIHIGDDKWTTQLDKPLYSGLIGSIATSFGSMREDYKVRLAIITQKYMDDFIESMTCEGEHGDDSDEEEKKRVKNAFKFLIDELKIVLFNISKEE